MSDEVYTIEDLSKKIVLMIKENKSTIPEFLLSYIHLGSNSKNSPIMDMKVVKELIDFPINIISYVFNLDSKALYKIKLNYINYLLGMYVINQNNINVNDVLELGYNGYIYIVKTNKSQKIKNILQNNIENCIKYIGIINLFISIIVFLIYITLSFLKIIKFNYISIFLFFIMLFLSLFSILLSFWMKRNNISSNYLKRNYIIKELIGLDNDYL